MFSFPFSFSWTLPDYSQKQPKETARALTVRTCEGEAATWQGQESPEPLSFPRKEPYLSGKVYRTFSLGKEGFKEPFSWGEIWGHPQIQAMVSAWDWGLIQQQQHHSTTPHSPVQAKLRSLKSESQQNNTGTLSTGEKIKELLFKIQSTLET